MQCSMYLLLNTKRSPDETVKNTPLQYDTGFSIFAYTYNAVLHLNHRIFNVKLLLKDYLTVIMGGGNVGSVNFGGR